MPPQLAGRGLSCTSGTSVADQGAEPAGLLTASALAAAMEPAAVRNAPSVLPPVDAGAVAVGLAGHGVVLRHRVPPLVAR